MGSNAERAFPVGTGHCIVFYVITYVTPYSLLANSAEINWWYFSYFSKKTGLNIPSKQPPLEAICMECQMECQIAWNVKSWFLGKIRKNISKSSLLKITPRVQSVKTEYKWIQSTRNIIKAKKKRQYFLHHSTMYTPDQAMWMRILIWAFDASVWHKSPYSRVTSYVLLTFVIWIPA